MTRTLRHKMAHAATAMAAAGAMASMPAAAQESGDAQQFQGELSESSPQSAGSPYEVRAVELQADKRYAFSAESDDFDTVLRVSFADDNDETLVENDDGGGGNNSYLEFIPARDGTYRVRVSSYGGEGGSYRLTMRDLPPLPRPLRHDPTETSMVPFRHFTGSLTDTDGEIGGRRVDDFLFHFEGGKRVFLFMDGKSAGFDPLLEVHTLANRGNTDPIVSNDDGGNGPDSVLVFTPEQSGDYIVRATSYSVESGIGDYELTVGQQP